MHVIKQRTHGPSYRIRHFFRYTIGVEAHALFHLFAARILLTLALDDDTSGNAHHRCTRRYSLGDHRVGTDLGTLAYFKGTENLRSGTNHHTVSDRGMSLALVPAGSAKGYALVKRNVIADHRGLANHDTHAMINEESAANRCTRMNLNAGKPTGDRRNGPRKPFQSQTPQPMGKPMEKQCVQTGIVGEHFKGIPGGGVPMEHAVNVFPQTLKHGHCPVPSPQYRPRLICCCSVCPTLSAQR